ncbi:MAG TPA: 2'-5' RNA ligase family protein [Humibacter sp.]|jgi:2'-5' RNA ligase|nr:2'-5' RNA ligase family protein [Humibacter sp.]
MSADVPTHPSRRSPGAFVIVAPLETVRPGSEFRTNAWPLHVTLVPPFTTSVPAEIVAELIASVCRSFSPLTVRAAGRELFGRRRDVPVITLEPDPGLLLLHAALMDAVEPVAEQHADRRNVRDRYRPHVSVQRGRSIAPSQPVAIGRVALIDRSPGHQAGLRRVVALASLAD